MFKRTARLERLMKYYDIANLSHGAKEDKLGDVYEDYCVEVFSDNNLLEKAKNGTLDVNDTDEYLYNEMLVKRVTPYIDRVKNISATNKIQHRVTGGNPKTDVIVDITTDEGVEQVPISIKQTTAPKVAMAEFDVDTIVSEIGIKDETLIQHLEKHQKDASAIKFTIEEKKDLTERLKPFVREFVRWVVTGSPNKVTDMRYPDYLVKFSLKKNDDINDINCFTVEQYVDSIVLDKKGNPKKGGFGTGLGWTYATGSKGKKIQFKG